MINNKHFKRHFFCDKHCKQKLKAGVPLSWRTQDCRICLEREISEADSKFLEEMNTSEAFNSLEATVFNSGFAEGMEIFSPKPISTAINNGGLLLHNSQERLFLGQLNL